jgi:hypothetical protein
MTVPTWNGGFPTIYLITIPFAYSTTLLTSNFAWISYCFLLYASHSIAAGDLHTQYTSFFTELRKEIHWRFFLFGRNQRKNESYGWRITPSFKKYGFLRFCDFLHQWHHKKGPHERAGWSGYNEIKLILINDSTMLIQLITRVFPHCHEIYHCLLSNSREDCCSTMKWIVVNYRSNLTYTCIYLNQKPDSIAIYQYNDNHFSYPICNIFFPEYIHTVLHMPV